MSKIFIPFRKPRQQQNKMVDYNHHVFVTRDRTRRRSLCRKVLHLYRKPNQPLTNLKI